MTPCFVLFYSSQDSRRKIKNTSDKMNNCLEKMQFEWKLFREKNFLTLFSNKFFFEITMKNSFVPKKKRSMIFN